MPRNVTGPAPGGSRWYVPDVEIDGWKNLDDPQPVRVQIKDPTEREKRKAFEIYNASPTGDGWVQHAIAGFVLAVENYVNRGVKIIDAATLAEHGETVFVANIAGEIMTALSLSDDAKKNSASSQGSPTERIPA